jgi:5'-nucleotidase
VVDADTGETPGWEGLAPSARTTVAGIEIGIIGVTTIDTPRTTIADNFAGLKMIDLAPAIEREATRMRADGVNVVLVAAHAGGRCREFHDPHGHDTCDADSEIFAVARALRTGLVDVIVAGHTHAGIAHRVNGIAIIESFANGRAFGRVDLIIRAGVIKESLIFPPRFVCGAQWRPGDEPCPPQHYEGKPVVPSPEVKNVVDAAMASTRAARERSLGVELAGKIRRSYREESALGNLFTDLMLAARPQADAALTNGGGLRADLPAGKLTYGELYQAMPFDNRFAFVTLTGAQLAELMAANLKSDRGVFSLAGVEVRARCAGPRLVVDLYRANTDVRIGRNEGLTVAISDFLAGGGDGAFARLGLPEGAIRSEGGGETIRDAMATALGKRGGTLAPIEVFDAKNPRLRYPGKRPVSCP